MNEKDIISMTRQISDCYSINKKSTTPFKLILYDLGDKLHSNLIKNNFQNWIGISHIKSGTYYNMKEIDLDREVVYLTADSDNEITELSEKQIYVIGGIVDRNKYKLLTLKKANEMGLKHGKLPIFTFEIIKSISN